MFYNSIDSNIECAPFIPGAETEKARTRQKAGRPLVPALNTTDKSDFIDVTNDFVCTYNHIKSSGGENDLNVGSVRTIDPIAKVYRDIGYFEISILNQGEKGCIGIGLTSNAALLDRTLGWEKFAIGYYANDKKLFYESANGIAYRPKYPTLCTDDVLGCGIDFKNNTVFFTRNGQYLGIAKSNFPNESWFPTIALHSKSERVEVNLKTDPKAFKFNLADYTYSGKKREGKPIVHRILTSFQF